MIRVLYYGLSNNPGGIETVAYKVNSMINSDKIKFTYLIAGNDLAYENDFVAHGDEIKKIKRFVHNPLKRILEYYRFFRTSKGKYDVLHCSYTALLSIEPIIFGKIFGIPKIILHSRASNLSNPKRINVIRHAFNKKLLKLFVSNYVACSNSAAEFMFPKDIVNNKKYQVIYNPADVYRFKYLSSKSNAIRQKYGIGINDLVLGHVGVFLPVKNHYFLLSVFKKIHDERPEAKLLLVGDGKREAVELFKKRVKEQHLEDSVIFVGKVSNVEDYLSTMDAFVFPSISEGFPNAVIEAQLSGLHCFVSDTITEEISIVDSKVHFVSLVKPLDLWKDIILKCNLHEDRDVDLSLFSDLLLHNIVGKYEAIYMGEKYE